MAKDKRVKSAKKLVKIESWSGADAVVRTIGDMQVDIQKAEAVAKKKVDIITAQLAEDVKPQREAIELYTESLNAFAAMNRNDFSGQQSKQLNFGTIGWRKSSIIIVKKATAGLIEAVFGKRAAQYMHVKVTPNKKAMAKLTDDELASVAAQRKGKEVFYVEPFERKAADYNG
jgi:phage host-nuclease inhibitor protein Gam